MMKYQPEIMLSFLCNKTDADGDHHLSEITQSQNDINLGVFLLYMVITREYKKKKHENDIDTI